MSSKSESRLTTAASLLRLVVEANNRKLSADSVTAIIDHVCQILPTSDGEYCFPLVSDYIRALSSLVQYPAHVEHLSLDTSDRLVQFCLTLTRDITRSASESNEASFGDSEASRGTRSMSIRPSPSSARDGYAAYSARNGPRDDLYPRLQGSASGIVSCLQHLFAVASTPFLDNAEVVLSVLFDLLQRKPNVSALQQSVLETIDSLIPRILTNNTKLALHTIRKVFEIFPHSWKFRMPGLKETILSILVRAECVIPALLSGESKDTCKTHLRAFLDTVKFDYLERRPKEMLLLEDLDLSSLAAEYRAAESYDLGFAVLRDGMIKAEEPWAVLRVSCVVLSALNDDSLRGVDHSNDHRDHEHLSKRRRVTMPLDEPFSTLSSSQSTHKVHALQLISFLFDYRQIGEENLHEHLDLIALQLSDEDSTVVSWALFALAW